MYKTLATVPIGVHESFARTLELASKYGFHGVSIGQDVLDQVGGAAQVAAMLTEAGIVAADAGLPVDFRTTEEAFVRDMDALPAYAQALRTVGCSRVSTWLLPGSDSLPFDLNLALHRERLTAVARVLAAEGIRFGLEYVGPYTSHAKSRHPFIYSQPGLFRLIEAIGEPNVGILLDAYHWYTSGSSIADLQALTNELVVLVHVNDAPSGIPVTRQIDLVRRMPGETGVIDMSTFMGALVSMAYDGPVLVEPFSDWVRQLPAEEAVRETADSLARIWPKA